MEIERISSGLFQGRGGVELYRPKLRNYMYVQCSCREPFNIIKIDKRILTDGDNLIWCGKCGVEIRITKVGDQYVSSRV